MLERLIESWLDSASERSIQAPFCQMLLADGHKVLQTTRHSPIEFGKDVVSISPEGDVHAYQLKGHPGARLTQAHLRAMLPQLNELVELSIPDGRVQGRPHKSFLVTNGEVAEEAHAWLASYNDDKRRRGYLPLAFVSRGELLERAQRLGAALWPSELQDVTRLMQLLVWDGRDQLPVERFHQLLSSVLLLDQSSQSPSQADLGRRLTSGALLTAVALRPFTSAENHVSVASAWALFGAYAAAAIERWFPDCRDFDGVVELAETAIAERLFDLTEELKEGTQDRGEDALTNAILRAPLHTQLTGWLSVWWLYHNKSGWPSEDVRIKLDRLVPSTARDLTIWGESALPYWLLWIWHLRHREGGILADQLLARLLEEVLKACRFGFPNAYYSISDVLMHKIASLIPGTEDPLSSERGSSLSFYAYPMFQLLVRANMKRSCKMLWPDLTRTGLREFIPRHPWQYSLWRSPEGKDLQRHLPSAGSWDTERQAAVTPTSPSVPRCLAERPFLLATFLMVAPHRASASAIRMLADAFYGPAF